MMAPDRPEERAWLHGRLEEPRASGRRFVRVAGSLEQRLATAAAFDRILIEGGVTPAERRRQLRRLRQAEQDGQDRKDHPVDSVQPVYRLTPWWLRPGSGVGRSRPGGHRRSS